MKKLSAQQYEMLRTWVLRCSRPLEAAMWRSAFEGGDALAVAKELELFGNADGGYGHAIEPDNWNPNSTINGTRTAVEILRDCGLAAPENEQIKGAMRFYAHTTDYTPESGWFFTTPGNDAYPHAAWWTYSVEENRKHNPGMSLAVAAQIIEFEPQGAELYERAMKLAGAAAAALLAGGFDGGEMGANGLLLLAQTLDRKGRLEELGGQALLRAVMTAVSARIERNVDNWKNYCARPSQFIHSPESPLYAGNEEIVEKELDYLIDTLPADEPWDITWHWYDGGKYTGEFAISRMWWRVYGAIEKISFLKGFDRIER